MDRLLQYLSDRYLRFWLALFPLTYLLHIVEEYWGGYCYSNYVLNHPETDLSPTTFLTLQSLGLILMIAGILLAIRFSFAHRMLVILGSVILVNGLVHTGRSISEGVYDPGLITSLVLWIPLGGATLLILNRAMPVKHFLLSLLIGAAISGFVALIASGGASLIKI